jgi:hypothetical protein
MRRFGGTLIACGLLVSIGIGGCGENKISTNTSPTPTATPEPPGTGPVITFLGLTRADDTLIPQSGTTATGVPVFDRQFGSSFSLVVEGKPGPSGLALGRSAYQSDLTSFPDLMVEVSRPLGNGSLAVCDVPGTPGPGTQPAGGVPAVDPPSFAPTQANIDAVNDLACRFINGGGAPIGRGPNESCVKVGQTADYVFVDSTSTIQFCGFITGVTPFPTGDTTVTVRLRDIAGNSGPAAQLVVHVGP